jgi:hypothetical protein
MTKRGLLSLISFVFFSAFAIAQDVQVYHVSLGNFSGVKVFDFPGIANNGLVYSKPVNQGLLQINLGDYTDYGKALELTKAAKKAGFINARVEEMNLSSQSTYYVQLASYDYFKQLSLDLSHIDQNRNLTGVDNIIRILEGPFASRSQADEALQQIKTSYSGAFIAKFPKELVHPIGNFYFDQAAVSQPQPQLSTYNSNNQGMGIDELLNEEIYTFWELHFDAKLKKISKPSIRGNKKRTSAIELQKLLKKDGSYNSSLDGYYGKGTKSAFDKAYNQDPVIQFTKSVITVKNENVVALEIENINDCLLNIPYEPKMCEEKLRTLSNPLAGAYIAYLEMIAKGPSQHLNKTMNMAIQLAFKNGSVNNNMRFDPKANYDYQNLEQIVQHLLYIHMNTGKEIPAPCWLYDYHIKDISAFSAKDPVSFSKIHWNNCSSMYDWEEMDILMQIVKQISVGNKNDFESTSGWNEQIDLIYNQSSISEMTAKANESWSSNMVTNVYKWGQKDAYLEKLSYSIRLLYYHNLVLLEDLFMDKGQSPKESKKMALAAMNNMIGPYMNDFN